MMNMLPKTQTDREKKRKAGESEPTYLSETTYVWRNEANESTKLISPYVCVSLIQIKMHIVPYKYIYSFLCDVLLAFLVSCSRFCFFAWNSDTYILRYTSAVCTQDWIYSFLLWILKHSKHVLSIIVVHTHSNLIVYNESIAEEYNILLKFSYKNLGMVVVGGGEWISQGIPLWSSTWWYDYYYCTQGKGTCELN